MDSPIANLDSRMTSASATASGTDGAATKQVTGQYLYDRFVTTVNEDVTKMGIVRDLVTRVDIASFKSAVKDMIGIAQASVKAAPEAQKVVFEGRLKTAMNQRNMMTLAFGAIKFASDELAKLGYTDQTGIEPMRVLAKRALDNKKVRWDGSPVLNDELRAKRDRERARKAELKAMADLMTESVRGDDESIVAYQTRIAEKVQERLDTANREKTESSLIKQAANLIKVHGADSARLIAEKVLYLLQHTDEMPADGADSDDSDNEEVEENGEVVDAV